MINKELSSSQKKNWLRDIGYLWISCGLKKFQSHMKMSHQERTYKRPKGKKIRNIVELMGWDILKGRKFIIYSTMS
jgi:hypothetical protein